LVVNLQESPVCWKTSSAATFSLVAKASSLVGPSSYNSPTTTTKILFF
jgi:hypothetical protein